MTVDKQLQLRRQEFNVGDWLDITSSVTFAGAPFQIQRVTDKAILVDDIWIPKSQILDICYYKFKKYSADCTSYEVLPIKQLNLSSWWDRKTNDAKGKGWAY